MQEYEYKAKIMGTDLNISLISEDKAICDNIYAKILEEVQDYEKTFSRFLPDSELSQINQKKDLIVSSWFIEVICLAKELFLKTQGYFNPLLQISRYGYDKSFTEITTKTVTNNLVPNYNIDFKSVIINEKEKRIILQDNQKLDFGGFLKGYLAEKMAKKIFQKQEHITGVIVNIGGDLYTLGLDKNCLNFDFYIYNPITQKDDLKISIHDQALATSGTYKRTWQRLGGETHHILNKDGQNNSETDIISVSVIHNSGACAEAYTKVFFSLNTNEALKVLADENIKFITISKTGNIIKNI